MKKKTITQKDKNYFCIKCGKPLLADKIEMFCEYYTIAGFCNNKKCERYLLLVL